MSVTAQTKPKNCFYPPREYFCKSAGHWVKAPGISHMRMTRQGAVYTCFRCADGIKGGKAA